MAEPQLPGGWLPPQAPTREAEPPRPPVFAQPEPRGTDGLAVAALVCAVVSMALLVLSLGLSFVLSLPLGLTGWACANRSAHPGTGRTLAIIAVALSVAAALVWIVLMLAGYSPDELQRGLEQELERQRRAS